MKKDRRIKMMAAALAIVMAVSVLPMLEDDTGLDAVVGDGGAYSYTINYDASLMSTTSAAISVAGMTPISHTGTPTTLQSMNEGSWTWNATTGLGPFNSFYGAFDIQNGNRFYAVLNPYDLTETISGQDLPTPLTRWNIMWVLPTVYVSSTATSLTLSNNPSSGTAYAHTIDGHVYKYVAIGVYEGSIQTLAGHTTLTSTTNTSPGAGGGLRSNFRDYAHNYSMDSSLNVNNSYPAHSMLWNFNMWQLYRMCSLTTMENFNSQNIVGNGLVAPNVSMVTGQLDSYGPYAGLPAIITDETAQTNYGSNSVKIFIENSWGGLWEYIDGIVLDGSDKFYLDSSSNPQDAKSGANITMLTSPTPSQSGFPTSIQTFDSRIWGIGGATVGGSPQTGLADQNLYNTSGTDRAVRVGGFNTWQGWSISTQFGINLFGADIAQTYTNANTASRLAFVFDADVLPKDLTFNMDPASGYGTLSGNSIADVPYYSDLTISGNTLTANGTTITATPAAADAQYTYSFDGWYSNGTQLTGTTPITDDMTITAHFSRVVNTYNVTVSSSNPQYGTVTLVGNISNTPYGSVIHLSGTNNNILTLNGSVVTATAADPTAYYTYSFNGYTNSGVLVQDGDIITGATSLIANFGSTAIHTVLITPNDNTYGTISVDQIIGVPTGSVFTVTDNVIEIYNTDSTATPSANTARYSYGFDNFTINGNEVVTGTTISGDTTVIANFTRTVNTYPVAVESNNTSWGTVSADSVSNVPYGSAITANGQNLTMNGQTVTATIVAADDAQYHYGFDGWYVGSVKIGSSGVSSDDDTTVTAVFTRTVKSYTITWNLYDDLTATTEVEYGTVPSYTPALRPGYTFVGWTPEPVAVTGIASYTAVWSELPPITVTFNGNGGVISFSSKTVYYGQPYGALPTGHMPKMQIEGWYTAAEGGDRITSATIVTAESDQTLYAHWEESDSYRTLTTMIDVLPILFIVAIIVGLIGTALYHRGE